MKTFWQGLLAAAIGGATTGATQALTTTGKVDKNTGAAAAVGALITALAFLKQSPITTPTDPK